MKKENKKTIASKGRKVLKDKPDYTFNPKTRTVLNGYVENWAYSK